MADPLYDQITAATLQEIKSDTLLDNFFGNMLDWHKIPSWERVARKRMVSMGVEGLRINEIISGMKKTGNYVVVEATPTTFDGGTVISEPFKYWDGNE